MTETELCKQVKDFLEIKGLPIYRNNTGAVKTGKRFVRFGTVGSPDFIGHDFAGRYVGIECKVGSNKQSQGQVEFERVCNKYNAIYILCYNLDDLEKKLKEKGVLK